MGRYNEILVGRFNKAVTKVFGMKGPAAIPQLAGDVQIAWTFFSGIEDHYPQGIEHFSTIFTVAAVAAQTPAVQIRNPLLSGMIATVEKLTISSVVAQDMEVSIGSLTTDLATLGTGQDRDGRGRPNSSCIPSSSAASAAALGNPIWIANGGTAPYEAIWRTEDEIIIFAGGALRVTWTTVNQAVRCAIYWRERAREDSELS